MDCTQTWYLGEKTLLHASLGLGSLVARSQLTQDQACTQGSAVRTLELMFLQVPFH